VFLIDHLDNSASYTQLQDGTVKTFDFASKNPEEGFKNNDPNVKKYWQD